MPQGGTAVGTGINAHPRFGKEFAKVLSKLSGHKIKSSNNFFHSISSQDLSVQVSGELKNLSVILIEDFKN